jgi:hypothetical protein
VRVRGGRSRRSELEVVVEVGREHDRRNQAANVITERKKGQQHTKAD